MVNDGGPAFPKQGHWIGYAQHELDQEGMSLRDYFAGQALAHLLMNPSIEYETYQSVAKDAYAIADAMLEARKES